MSSTESKLMWIAIAISLVLVLALGTLAVYSVLGQEDGTDAGGGGASDTAVTAASTGGAVGSGSDPSAPELAAARFDPALSVTCDRSTSSDRGYAVAIANRGGAPVDYIVSIELTIEGSSPLVASTRILDLAPGETREVIVNAAGPNDRRISDCSIAAIQTDRRVLLANS